MLYLKLEFVGKNKAFEDKEELYFCLLNEVMNTFTGKDTHLSRVQLLASV